MFNPFRYSPSFKSVQEPQDFWQDPVMSQVDFTTAEPAAPTSGDRYINTGTGNSSITSQAVISQYIYEWNGASWTETVAKEGMILYIDDVDQIATFNGVSWVVTTSLWKKAAGIVSLVTPTDTIDVLGGNFTTYPTVAGVSINANGVLSDLTTVEVNQLENIDGTTISAAQWGYLGSLDQSLTTASSPTFAGLTLSGLGNGFLTATAGVVSSVASINLVTDVAGILPIANGGTNSSAILTNNRVMVSSAGTIIESASITTSELGLLDGMLSVSTGVADNDKLVTQGYVDDAISGYGYVAPPITPTTVGSQGEWSYSAGYFYKCVATNVWVRTAVATTW